MGTRGGADAESASYDSSSSASSDDAVLITKEHRQKLQALHAPRDKQEQQKEKPPMPPTTIATKSPVHAKPDHICGVCERDGGDLVVCTGSCVSAFHVACLQLTRDAIGPRDAWKCPNCVAGTHICFHCKQLGRATSDTVTSSSSDDSSNPNSNAPPPSNLNSTGGDNAPVLRAVVKCRALSCGKFYHHTCIAKLPLARIAGTRFICPLHTCAACEQSGAKKEPVRCTRCAVAYHTSCLPRNGVVPLPGKRIICPKHEGQALPLIEETEKVVEEEGQVQEPTVKPLPAIGRVSTAGGEDQEAVVSVAALSPRTEENDDDETRSDASGTGGSSGKKHAKSSKKDKKKKKKKKKKDKKKEKERSNKGADNDASEKEDGGKKAKKTKNSLKVGRQSEDDDGGAGEAEVEEKTTVIVHTASEDDGGEEKAALIATPVKKEKDPELGRGEPHASSTHAVVSKTDGEDTIIAAVAVTKDSSDDHVKPEFERVAQTDATPSPTENRQPPEEEGTPSPIPAASEPVKSEAIATVAPTEDPDKPDQNEVESTPSHETTERASPSPVKSEEKDQTRDALTVQIPEIPTLPTDTQDDHDADDDSGSGSGSQSTKARANSVTLSRLTSAEETVKEKASGGGGGGGGGGSSSRSKKSKKKRKGGNSKSSSGGGDDAFKHGAHGNAVRDEAKWVQCDACKKWRTVAKEIDLDAMPETWYCHMNTWHKAFASCDVPEEMVETAKSTGSNKPAKRGATATALALGDVSTPVGKKPKLTKQTSGPLEPSVALVVESLPDAAAVEKETKAPMKKADKDSKKRKLKLKLREKYGEVNWVQCENKQCGKWRVVPSSASALPSVWVCHLNTWAPELASCTAANPPEVEAYLSKSQSKKPSGTRPPKRQRLPDHQPPDQAATLSTAAVSSHNDTPKPPHAKPSKASSKSSTPTAHVGATVYTTGHHASTPHSGAVDDGRSARVLSGVKSVVLEWAQCEKCLKWRKLPAHIKSSTLPDKWYCPMNHWDPSRASCALPQEEDQEPLESPIPGVGAGGRGGDGSSGGRTTSATGGGGTLPLLKSKRGKLSYSELLYASTGQLRKTYTSDSSTLAFEYEGVLYHRDDQYKHSSMYVSPLPIPIPTTTTHPREERSTGEDPSSSASYSSSSLPWGTPSARQHLIDKIATVILATVDLRRAFAITEIVDSVLRNHHVTSGGELSLSVITAAIAQLVTLGELEKVEKGSSSHSLNVATWPSVVETASATTVLLRSLSSQPAYYRKVPKRPLKALKAWKLAASF